MPPLSPDQHLASSIQRWKADNLLDGRWDKEVIERAAAIGIWVDIKGWVN